MAVGAGSVVSLGGVFSLSSERDKDNREGIQSSR